MNPSKLKPGMRLFHKNNPARIYIVVGRSALHRTTVTTCADYVGLAGPDDEGRCTISDWDMSRKFELVPMARAA